MFQRCFARSVCTVALVFGVALTAMQAIAQTRLQGAGATFPAPFYKQLVVVYQGINPNVLSNYGGSFVHRLTRRIEIAP